MGICDINLQNRPMSLTHSVPNDNLSLRCGLYSAMLVNFLYPCCANEQIINFTTTLHYYDTIFYEWSSKLLM